MKDDDLFRKAIEVYGMDAQLDVLQEECAELICATSAIKRNKKDCIEWLIDELADVQIMIDQITFACCLQNQVHRREEFKLKRLRERLTQA